MTNLIAIKPLKDPIIDTLGYDSNDDYCKNFWLPILGPTAFLLLKHLIEKLEVNPEGYPMDTGRTSQNIGLRFRIGKHPPVRKSLERYCVLGLGKHNGGASFVIRRSLPPLSNRHVGMLPDFITTKYSQWLSDSDDVTPGIRTRSRASQYATRVLRNRSDKDTEVFFDIEKMLLDRGFTPSVTTEVIEKMKKTKKWL